MRARLIPALLFALAAAWVAAQETVCPPATQTAAVGEPALRVSCTPSADRGTAISGQVLAAGPLRGLAVELLRPNPGPASDPTGEPGGLLRAAGFRLEAGSAPGPQTGPEPGSESAFETAPRGAERWAFLLGLPSSLEPGPYLLRIRVQTGQDEPPGAEALEIVHVRQVTVRGREFRSEDIWFDASLTRLMTTPDPRREREAVELREVLAAFDPAAVRHTGTLQLPVQDARRTSLFADRRLYRYVDGGSSRSLHNGVDLAAPEGAPVLACGSGRVALCGPRLMSGGSVVLEHLPGVYTLYYHLQEVLVREGDLVAKGAPIGTVGQTGLATGPHLHWEMRIAGVPVDPEAFLERPLIDKSTDSSTLGEGAEP